MGFDCSGVVNSIVVIAITTTSDTAPTDCHVATRYVAFDANNCDIRRIAIDRQICDPALIAIVSMTLLFRESCSSNASIRICYSIACESRCRAATISLFDVEPNHLAHPPLIYQNNGEFEPRSGSDQRMVSQSGTQPAGEIMKDRILWFTVDSCPESTSPLTSSQPASCDRRSAARLSSQGERCDWRFCSESNVKPSKTTRPRRPLPDPRPM